MAALVKKRRIRKQPIELGPQHAGTRMSLDEFDRAIVPNAAAYELNKGVIEVSDVPGILHAVALRTIRQIVSNYEESDPGIIAFSGNGAELKILIAEVESERHPDWAVYLTEPPTDSDQPWSEWVPDIVIEVVSESSRKRDYEDKPPEYLALGVREYWLVDLDQQVVIRKTRWRGIWKDTLVKPGQSVTTTLLPGFKLDVKKVFADKVFAATVKKKRK
jgi:Uma2 family endonuclease